MFSWSDSASTLRTLSYQRRPAVARYLLRILLVVGLLHAGSANLVSAAQPSEKLLPVTTKGYLSIPDLNELRARWDQTQLGQLVNDPVMKPFVDDLRRQISRRLNQADARLGISWADVEHAYGGEVCLALIQPWDEEQEKAAIAAAVEKSVSAAKKAGRKAEEINELRAKALKSARSEQERQRVMQKAIVMLVDVTGHQTEAEKLLAKISNNLRSRGGSKSSTSVAGVPLIHFTFPKKEGEAEARQVFYGIHRQQLVAADNRQVIASVLSRLDGRDQQTSLASSVAFHTAMTQCRAAFADTEPQLRWFVEPFGYVEVARAYAGGRRKRGMDLLKVLAHQGFTAIQGLGGLVALSTDEHEILHRSFVYAPPVKRADGDKAQGRFNLAANMLDFPNKALSEPPSWVPADVATYMTFSWRMKEAFEHSKSLVNEIAGDDVFEDVLRSIETDPSGPQINIRRQLVAHLAERATVIADYREPITTQCERIMLAIELTNPPAVQRAIDKAMESDPTAKRRVYHDHVIWEILNEDPEEIETLKIDEPTFGFGFDEPEPVEEEEPFMPNSAITVAHGQLLIGSHVDYIVSILEQAPDSIGLERSGDFAQVQRALDRLGAGADSFRFFSRTEQTYHPTYELIRQGKMPESETLLGQLLNRILGPEEEGATPREQLIDSKNMPSFEAVRKYLGPSGAFVHSEQDGWTVSGCLLKK